MEPQYTEAEFSTANPEDKLPLRCRQCSIIYYLSKKRIKSCLSPSRERGARGDFCSRSCVNTFRGPPVTVICKQCGNSFSKILSDSKRSPNHFCCKSCAAKYNNAHKIRGTRVSKLEVWLQAQLSKLYPNLEFHFNRTDAINGELDIYIPSLKLAFELNGIFHYEPIYGAEKLAKMQTNDARKFQACLERGIELCIVDVSRMTNFKEKGALKYLEVIQKVLDNARARFERAISGL